MLRNMTLTSFPIRGEELAQVKATAKRLGVSQAEVIRRAVQAFVKVCPLCGQAIPKKKRGKV
ncbi:MAG: ribbon-helix-helix protein, CopG family [Nitrospirae bacterium]|nr:ribbon-helix-helix protein, CopG family [Nitrospirota bacterium]